MSPPLDHSAATLALRATPFGLALEREITQARPESTSSASPATELPARSTEHDDVSHKRSTHGPRLDVRRGKSMLFARIAGATLISGIVPAGFHLWIASGAVMPKPAENSLTNHAIHPPLASHAPEPETSVSQAASPANPEQLQPARSDPDEPDPFPSREKSTIEKSSKDVDVINETREAYDAYQAGKLEDAFQRYSDALTRAPHNTDILNALGLISFRLGLRNDAERYWRQTTQLDPANAAANAHLSMLQAGSSQSSPEHFLRAQLVAQPEASSLLFALGSLYAQQGRWVEAQQMFFEAHTHEPENPDTAYNLAVALDHLGQAEAAARFYLLAHTASAANPAGFDIDHAVQRARTLLARTAPKP